jgi:NADH:ubiquinone oxidoreductase subunit F (NADH-binding)/(2Fe-2S) ferredoxin
MAKLTTSDLERIRSAQKERLAFRDKTYLLICGGTGCHATGSIRVKDALLAAIEEKGLSEKVEVIETGCNGFCALGPLLVIHPGDILYEKLTVEDMPELVESHLINGKPVERLLYKDPVSKAKIAAQTKIPFFAHQMPRALRNKGLIDPESIDAYIGRDGYVGAAKALFDMTPEQIIEEMKISGMRGRGGAGFPTGVKWDFASQSVGAVKYVLCNADEGDPGAFMDRSILEADPHSVLEGMIIAAKAIDAHKGYIYARTEYPLAIKRLGIAIDQATEYGLLGDRILGSEFSFDIEVYQGAGAFVCGEETALMRSIEGRRGMPRPRPPFPAHKGLWEKPTILNNVETLANVPQIMVNGGAWYASVGTETSKGTKVFALSGDVNNIGLVEVPMGTSLRTIIYDIGGGIPKKRKFKAVQLGGPSGGCVPEAHLDTPVDYEAIARVGAIMGSGGAIVMDEKTCMVDMARFSWSSSRMSPVANAPPAGRARAVNSRFWKRSAKAAESRVISIHWSSFHRPFARPPCAGWVRRDPIRYFRPCVTSGTSSRPIFTKSDARPNVVWPFLNSRWTRRPAPIAGCASGPARPMPSHGRKRK